MRIIMRKLLLLIMLCANYSYATNCHDPITQAEMNNCSYQDSIDADKKLDELYTRLLIIYSNDKVYIDNIRKSQELWLKFRIAQLNMRYPNRDDELAYYGSFHPVCVNTYYEKLTNDRINQLNELLESKEEDICAST